MSNIPLFSALIPWGDRADLVESLPRNGSLFERHGVEIVIVNLGGRFETLREIVRASGVPNVVTIDLPVTRVAPHSPVTWSEFNRSLCLNVAAMASRGQYLFMMDSDIVLQTDLFPESREHLATGTRFVSMERLIETNPKPPRNDGVDLSCFLAEVIETRELVTKDGRRAVLRERCYSGLRGSDGILLVRRDHMQAVGGMNSMLSGWGYEDSDFQMRLQLLLGLERIEVGTALHLTHPSGRNDASWQRNRLICARNYCAGEFHGTWDQDAERWASGLLAART